MAKTKASKIEEYNSLDDAALESRIEEEEVRLKKMKFSHAVNPIENPRVIREIRRDIARMKTVQRKRELDS